MTERFGLAWRSNSGVLAHPCTGSLPKRGGGATEKAEQRLCRGRLRRRRRGLVHRRGLGAALLLGQRLARFKGFFRTALFAPVVTTLVAVAVIWRYLLQTPATA